MFFQKFQMKGETDMKMAELVNEVHSFLFFKLEGIVEQKATNRNNLLK